MPNRSKSSFIAGIALVIVLLGGGVWFFFLRSDAPPEVDIDAATEQVTSTTEGQTTTTTDPEIPGTIEGTWVVDDETGEFDFESATGSFAGFRVTEELVSIGSSDAVGRTGEVTGEMVITATTVESVEVTVDMTGIESDKPRRDNKIQEALETDEFPTASFTSTGPVELEPAAAEGDQTSVEVTGDLTIHGVTRTVTLSLDAQLVDDTAVVVGSIPIEIADFDIEVPSAPVVLSVSDEATIEFQLLFERVDDTPDDAGDTPDGVATPDGDGADPTTPPADTGVTTTAAG